MGPRFELARVPVTVPMRSGERRLAGGDPGLPDWSAGSEPKPANTIVHGQKLASTNWAGQIYTGPKGVTTFTEVAGDWHVPSVTPSTSLKEVATWIGIGGVGTPSSLIQVGTTVTAVDDAVHTSAWVELFPTPPMQLNMVVDPGDSMEAEVKQNSNGKWDIVIEDVTRGWRSTSTTLVHTATYLTTAEWITERGTTSVSHQLVTLADFGTTRFTHLSVTGTHLTAAHTTASYMIDAARQIAAYPGSVLSTTTGHFTNSYGTPLPTVDSVSPDVGTTAGGTSVTISGTYIVPGLVKSVQFGTLPASGTTNTSGVTTAKTPPQTAGVVNVTVTTTDGTSVDSDADTFTYVTSSIGATRIYGTTPDGTAAAEFVHQFPYTSDACPASRSVVLAADADYPDALASSYLARSLETGTLLTPAASLSSPASTAISQEGIAHVYIVGGPLAVSTEVLLAISRIQATACGGARGTGDDVEVTRIWGATEYETAQQIATAVPSTHVGALDVSTAYSGTYDATGGAESASASASGVVKTAVLATGTAFQDAEAAGAFAYGESVPILLTTPSTLSPEAASALSSLGIRQVIVMGGPLAVSNGVVGQLGSLGVSALRVSGPNYTGTAVELARFEMGASPDGADWPKAAGAVTVAQGASYSDGLAGAVVAADGPSTAKRQPLLLTLNAETVGTTLASFLKGSARQLGVSHLTVLGGPDAVSQAAVTAMLSDVAGS
jgi:putative cell wall-binding protein